MDNNVLTLNQDDPRIMAARNAEEALYSFYGLKPKTHYIPLPGTGIRVRVSEIGEGKPIVIMPGNTGDVFPLIPLIAELKNRRVIAINRPGGGLSEGMDHRIVDLRKFEVNMISTVLDAFALDSAPIVAHSIGAHFSLWMAIDKPERVTALALLGSPGNIMGAGPPFPLRLLAVPGLNSLLFKLVMPKDPSKSLMGLRFMGHSAETLASLPNGMSECYYYFQKLPHYKISSLSLMESSVKRLNEDDLKQIQQPVILLWGTNDPFGSVQAGQQIANALPASEFHSLQGGHLPWLDEPEESGRLIFKFLSRH
ncbi:MAG TPA: alpha/beta hydrolase [Mucilaginibacter sp.]|nr:alpha/beta hydrolase [Mucilaginibacter sp.]